MPKSIFFRRMLVFLLIAMLLWTALTAVLYSFISRPIFTQIKVDELEPKARFLADLASNSFMTENAVLSSFVQSSYELFDAWTYIVDGVTGEIRASELPDSVSGDDQEIRELIAAQTDTLMSGRYSSLSFTKNLSFSNTDMIFVGVPVHFRFGRQSAIIGTVFFVKPLEELNAGLRSMNTALMFSALLVMLMMILPAYWAAARMTRPLRQTRDVALALADGNFSIRADDSQNGEIGELARAMNHLSRELSATISALTLERNRLKQVIDGVADGIIAVDGQGEVTLINAVVWPIFGQTTRGHQVSAEDILQISDLKTLFLQTMQNRSENSQTIQVEHRLIFCHLAPLEDAPGAIVGAVGLFRDITESERLEQTRRDYVANVSHELRTPLTAMRALLEPLNEDMVRSEQDVRRYHGILLRETIRLSRLIDDMLELSRLQAGSLSFTQEAFNLSDLLQDLVQKYEQRADELDLTLGLNGDLDNPVPAFGNQDRIEQVLVVLIDNAMKFTPAGGRITLSLECLEKQWLVTVQDTGTGISPEDIDHIFDRFYKADKAHHYPGTGLGLAIAREIMTRMGQTLSVRSEPEQGAAFTISLPRADQI